MKFKSISRNFVIPMSQNKEIITHNRKYTNLKNILKTENIIPSDTHCFPIEISQTDLSRSDTS